MENVSEATEATAEAVLHALEQRVHKLEQMVVVLQNTQVLEERIVERLSRKPEVTRVEQVVSAPPLATLYPVALPSASPSAAKPRWIVLELMADLKSMVLMFFDIRFHVAWTTRLMALIVLPVILTGIPFAYLPIISSIPILAGLVPSVIHLFLAFFLFKFLCRDAQRYRESRAIRR